MMNYKIIEEKNGKFVVFENGERYSVGIDKNGMEYFHVDNQYSPDLFKLFIGRVRDVYMTIRDGDGDAVATNILFEKNESVVRFLDREYGESLRKQVLAESEKFEFGYSVKFGFKDSMHGYNHVAKDLNGVLGFFDNPYDYIYFNTETEAEEAKNGWIKKAQIFTEKYNSIKKEGNEKEIEKVADDCLNAGIVSKIWYAMVRNLDWELEIVQAINPSTIPTKVNS